MYKHFFKRIFDFLTALIGLVVLSPLFIFITIGLYIANRGKPFFFQKRSGRNAKPFYIVKFKTMNDKRDQDGNLLPDAERLTRIGVFVRKTSLDEIPQFINILKGDMSLIGPRPLLPEYENFYDATQKRRSEITPGITGWAQVNGRNAISWEERFRLDVWYVDHVSFALDLKILLLTIQKTIKSEGINDANGNIKEAFDKYMIRKNG